MATLLSIGSGNWTSSGTWGVVDSTSFLDSTASASSLTASAVNSASFIPGAITISGFAVRFRGRTLSPTATITGSIYNVTGAAVVAGTSVTINVSDLPACIDNTSLTGVGWTYFKFSSPVTLLAATSYAVRLSASASFQISVYRNATAGNWSRALVTTTTAAPAATDTIIVAGEYTAASTNATYTVTMDSTSSAVSYGTVYVGAKGKLSYGTSAATNYYLKMAGSLIVMAGGIFEMGTSGTPMPSDSTATLEITTTTASQYGIFIEGQWHAYGASKTSFANLAADMSAGATTSTTDVSTGWLSGDLILYPTTSTTYTQNEALTLNANASGTGLSHNASSFAHGGNAATYVQAEIANLTRNVKILATNVATPPFSLVRGYNSKAALSYVEFRNFGSTSTGTAALSVSTVSGASGGIDVSVDNCSFYRTAQTASTFAISLTADPGNNGGAPVQFAFTNNTVYNFGTSLLTMSPATATTTWTTAPYFANNLFCATASGQTAVAFTTVMYSFYNNRVCGAGAFGWYCSVTTALTAPTLPNLNISGNTVHSNSSYGAYLDFPPSNAAGDLTINGLTAWRNGAFGLYYYNSSFWGPAIQSNTNSIVFNNVYLFGNTSSGLTLRGAVGNIRFVDLYAWAGSTSVQNYGLSWQNGNVYGTQFVNCSWGYLPNGVTVSNHALANVAVTPSSRLDWLALINNKFSGTDIIWSATIGGLVDGPLGMMILKHNQTAGSHRTITQTATLSTDTVIFNTATPSLRIAPISATWKSASHIQRVAVNSGNTATVSVAVRKSAAGDGSAYNGAQPRLMYRYNALAGNTTADLVAATMTVANGSWETLTYTTPTILEDCVLEFYVDCDGSAGWVNVDDWSSGSTKNNSTGYKYWSAFGPYIEMDSAVAGGSGGGSFTFVS